MYSLFELDEHYPLRLHEIADDSDPSFPKTHIAMNFRTPLLDEFLTEWQERKKDLADGIISKVEYMDWKLNWPQTAGKNPTKQWRQIPKDDSK
jgi:hypothetical protein